jgi:hypothetical protein
MGPNTDPDSERSDPTDCAGAGIIAFWVVLVVACDVGWAYVFHQRSTGETTAALTGAYLAYLLAPAQLLFIGFCVGLARTIWARALFFAHGLVTIALLAIALTNPK